jgi:dipeptidase E
MIVRPKSGLDDIKVPYLIYIWDDLVLNRLTPAGWYDWWMKLLLTSSGLSNESIRRAFHELVGKPVEEIKVAFIVTAGLIDDGDKEWMINDMYRIRQSSGYVDVIDLAQLSEAEWLPRVEIADVIFVGGGNAFYLSYHMQRSGLMAQLPRLLQTRLYAGISAGSMMAGSSLRIASQALAAGELRDDEYDELGPPGRSSAVTAKFVDLVIRPHMNSRFFPEINGECIQSIADELAVPVYAIDDQSAVQVVDGDISVISEGDWKRYEKDSKVA